ncbi:MAG: hypothetical protein AABZ60_16425 [Planctomycetota bacterium]
MKYTLLILLLILIPQLCAQEDVPTLDTVKKFLQEKAPSSISFDGMFAGIEKLGPKTLDHLNTLISDPDFEIQYRMHIPRAMGELGNKDAIPLLKGYMEDIFMEDQIKGEIQYALYALGETEALDNFLTQVQTAIKQVSENPPPPDQATPEQVQQQITVWYVRMKEVSYRTKKYDITCLAYEALSKMYPKETEWYNWACTLSLAGRLEESIEKLKIAVENSMNRFSAEDIESDGDLRNLHSHPEFIAMMKKLRENPPKHEEKKE